MRPVIETWLWSDFEGNGGTRLGLLQRISGTVQRTVNGDDLLRWLYPLEGVNAGLLTEGRVVRFEFALGDPEEWRLGQPQRSGLTPFWVGSATAPRRELLQYLVSYEDAQGHVSFDVPFVQETPANILTRILATGPALFVLGTVTPTDRLDLNVSNLTALAAIALLEVETGYEAEFVYGVGGVYTVNLVRRGAAEVTRLLAAGKNVLGCETRARSEHERINRLVGFGEDGGTIAWAFLRVVAVAGNAVEVAHIHDGPDIIAFDDQFNHVGLPGGTNSLYLERRDGTRTQITDSDATTQELTVADATGIAAGHWVRVVASSTGRHLTTLDNPADIASGGVRLGQLNSEWGHGFNLLEYGLPVDWPGAANTLPTGWTGLTLAGAEGRITTENNFLFAGQALFVEDMTAARVLRLERPQWLVRDRMEVYSAIVWVRATALTPNAETLGIEFRGVGQKMFYTSPINVWVALKIENVQLDVGAQTLDVELTAAPGATWSGYIAGFQINAGPVALSPIHGAGAARIMQAMQYGLLDRLDSFRAYDVAAVDLHALGEAQEHPLTIGAPVRLEHPTIAAGMAEGRIVEATYALDDARRTSLVVSTLPIIPRRLSKPPDFNLPYFEPIHIQISKADERNAAMRIKATITASDAATVTAIVEVSDSHGGSPAVIAEVFGAVLEYGAGTGPYLFRKPVAGTGMGRAVFTARLAGRSDVYDAIDIEEDTTPTTEGGIAVVECRIVPMQHADSDLVILRVYGLCPAGTPDVMLVSHDPGLVVINGAALGVAIPTIGTYRDWEFSRLVAGFGYAPVRFQAILPGYGTDDDEFNVAEEGDSEIRSMIVRPRVVTVTDTQVIIRVALVTHSPALGVPGAGTITPDAPTLLYSPTGVQAVTPEWPYEENNFVEFTIERPDFNSGDQEFWMTGAVDVAFNRIPDRDVVNIPARLPLFLDALLVTCHAEIVAMDATTVTVRGVAYGAPGTLTGVPLGAPEVEYTGVSGGGATLNTGAAINTPVASGSLWVFNRGITGDTLASFRAIQGSALADIHGLTLPEETTTTDRVLALARVVGVTPTTLTVRVYTADTVPQGPNSVSVAYVSGSGLLVVVPASPQTTTPEAVLSNGPATYVEFTVIRPAAGAADDDLDFTVTATGRITATDHQVVPAQESLGAMFVRCVAQVTVIEDDFITVRVTAFHPAGHIPSVSLVNVDAPASYLEGPAFDVPSGLGEIWKITRGVTSAVARFRAALGSGEYDYAEVMVPALASTAERLSVLSRIIAIDDDEITVLVSVADPTPQGANSATISATYQNLEAADLTPTPPTTVTPEATITEAAGTGQQYVILRPTAAVGDGLVVFQGTAANRISASDPVIVPSRPDLVIRDLGTLVEVAPTSEMEFKGLVKVTDEDDGVARLTIGGPSASLYAVAPRSPARGSGTILTWDPIVWDMTPDIGWSALDPGFSRDVNDRILVPEDGLYMVTINLAISKTAGAGDMNFLEIYAQDYGGWGDYGIHKYYGSFSGTTGELAAVTATFAIQLYGPLASWPSELHVRVNANFGTATTVELNFPSMRITKVSERVLAL